MSSRSASQNLLLVARDLGPPGEPFDLADLVLSAWRKFPEQFGLRGRVKESASDNTVATFVMGKRGFVGRQYFAKAGPKRYTLTPAGIEQADRIDRGESVILHDRTRPTTHPGRWKLGAEVNRMLGTRAYTRYAMGQVGMITWDDAVAFWQVDLGDLGTPMVRRFSQRTATVAKAIAGASGGIRIGDRDVTAVEVQRLGELDARLREMFGRQLKRVGVAQKERAA